MINLIRTNQKFPGEIIEDVKKGKIHVVYMAQNGLTHLNVYAELYCKLEKTIVNQCVDLVNSKKETGTLFQRQTYRYYQNLNHLQNGIKTLKVCLTNNSEMALKMCLKLMKNI